MTCAGRRAERMLLLLLLAGGWGLVVCEGVCEGVCVRGVGSE